MTLFLAAILVGVGVGYLRGGRWQALGSFRARWPALPAVALALQMVLAVPVLRGESDARLAFLVASYLLIGTWLWMNALLREGALRQGLILMAEGWLLNVVVMAANGGMPVSGRALAAVGKAGVVVSEGQLWKHVPLTAASKIPLLGDVIPVPLPLLRSVISVGDVAMLVGLAVAVTAVMGQERVRSLPVHAALVHPPGA